MIFSLSVLLLAGCMDINAEGDIGANSIPHNNDNFFDGYDDMGTKLVLASKPKRIVSLNLGTDEVVLALADIENIVAVTIYADDPGLSNMSELGNKVAIKLRDKSPERILALQPDLVITNNGVPKELIDSLRNLGMTVFVSRTPKRIEEVFNRIENIGKVIGEEENANRLMAGLRAKLSKVKQVTDTIPEEERPIVIAFSFNGVFGRAGGLFDDMCRQAGMRNGAGILGLAENYEVSMEQVVALDPEVILLPTWSNEGDSTEEFLAELKNDPLFKNVRAVKAGRIYEVSDCYRYSASQNAVEGVYALSSTVFADKFKDLK